MQAEIIANPTSGSFNEQKLDQCIKILKEKLSDITVSLTNGPNEAGGLAAKSNADVIIAAGGDGLINEAAAGMVGKEAGFSVLPFGTVNVFCREHKIPLNPLKAARVFNPDNRSVLPLGYLGERPFLLMCGIGYDASVVRNVTEKKYHGHKTIAHLKEGVAALGEEYPQLKIYIDGQEYAIYHAIISLGHLYAGNFVLSRDIQSETLNVFVHQTGSARRLFGSILSIVVGGGFPDRAICTDNVKVVGTKHFQLDGEYIHTDVDENYVSIKKSALTFVK